VGGGDAKRKEVKCVRRILNVLKLECVRFVLKFSFATEVKSEKGRLWNPISSRCGLQCV